MNNRIRHIIILLGLLVSIDTSSASTGIARSLTGTEWQQVDSLENYSFIVSGHFHGASNNTSGYPAATILANIDRINNSQALFIGSTGDLFLDVRNNIDQYKLALFNKLKIPLYNAVGNHDISGQVYQENFGNTWFSFRQGKQLFIFLDTEINDGSIQNDQLEFLKNVLEEMGKRSVTSQVFIFSHRPVWAEGDQELENAFKENTKSDFSNNYQSEILPLIKKYNDQADFYWFSGSLGGDAPASFFYYQKSKHLYYIQSAIRDLPRDGMLLVKINEDQVSFETISLTGKPMPKLEECGLEMWKKGNPDAGFNYRLLPLYLKQMFFHRYFWYGIGYSLLGYVVLYLIRRKIKRKKIA